jgi:hypothetical protein
MTKTKREIGLALIIVGVALLLASVSSLLPKEWDEFGKWIGIILTAVGGLTFRYYNQTISGDNISGNELHQTGDGVQAVGRNITINQFPEAKPQKGQPDVRVECSLSLVSDGPDLQNPGKTSFINTISFIAKNFDERPVTLSSLHVKLKSGKYLFINPNSDLGYGLPRRLEYGQSHTIVRRLEGLKKDLQNEEPDYAFYTDQLDNRYASDKKNSEKLKKLLKGD